jgi:hypothetical protein
MKFTAGIRRSEPPPPAIVEIIYAPVPATKTATYIHQGSVNNDSINGSYFAIEKGRTA